MGRNKSSELISLRTENNQLTAQIHDLTAENQVLATEVERLRPKLERMNELLLNAQRSRFGQSSEKRTYVLPNEEQLRLFNEVEAVQDPKEPDPVDETPAPEPQKPKKENKERKSKRTIADLLKDHPAEEVLLDLDDEQKLCPVCGQPLTKIGKKLLRYELRCPRQALLHRQRYRQQPCRSSAVAATATVQPFHSMVYSTRI